MNTRIHTYKFNESSYSMNAEKNNNIVNSFYKDPETSIFFDYICPITF